jgi:hypothetical protein
VWVITVDAAIDAAIVRTFGLQETKANTSDGQREDVCFWKSQLTYKLFEQFFKLTS